MMRAATARAETAEVLAARWNARIARARELAARYPATAELLAFRAVVAEFQQTVAALPASPPALRTANAELGAVAAMVPMLLSLLGRSAPAALANAARSISGIGDAEWRADLARCWADGGAWGEADVARAFVVEALLQPWAERAALELGEPTPVDRSRAECPACGGAPVVAALRDATQGARRSLICGFCLTEWGWPRIVCPGCGERTFSALPVYTTPEFPAARIDACETCWTYIQAIDLTKDATAIPEVDEIAGVPLDLWAREQGYAKLRPNLLGE